MNLLDRAMYLPLRILQIAGTLAGFCIGALVVGSILTAVLMGAWLAVEILYFMGTALFGG